MIWRPVATSMVDAETLLLPDIDVADRHLMYRLGASQQTVCADCASAFLHTPSQGTVQGLLYAVLRDGVTKSCHRPHGSSRGLVGEPSPIAFRLSRKADAGSAL